MNELPLNRVAVMLGWTLAAMTAVWWLGSTRLALDQGRDAAGAAADTLCALFLVRAMALAISSTRVGVLRGWRRGMATCLGMIAPSWPVVLAAWSASVMPFTSILLGEAVLLAGSFALPLIGVGLRRLLHPVELAVIAGTAIGVALAGAVWHNHSWWLMVPS